MNGHKRGIYNTNAKQDHRKQLRRSLTAAEAVLWKSLQGRKLEGYKFRRQFSIGPYIVDFYCPEYRLAVELDGAGHMGVLGGERDAKRTEYLERRGIQVLRFENQMVYDDLEYLLNAIVKSCIPEGCA